MLAKIFETPSPPFLFGTRELKPRDQSMICDFIEGNSSLYVTTLPHLVAVVIVVAKININLSRDLARPRDQRVLWLYRRKLLIICNRFAMFGGHMQCDSRDITSNFSRDLGKTKRSKGLVTWWKESPHCLFPSWHVW